MEPQPVRDQRGSLTRTWCSREFSERGLEVGIAQASITRTRCKGTIRGLHFQTAPYEETKLVRCTRGAIFDVIVDLRQGSTSFLRAWHVRLSAENERALYIPKGVAHGLQTLEDDTEVSYLISEFYNPDSATGIRWNDETLSIRWPLPLSVISERDLNLPLLDAYRCHALSKS